MWIIVSFLQSRLSILCLLQLSLILLLSRTESFQPRHHHYHHKATTTTLTTLYEKQSSSSSSSNVGVVRRFLGYGENAIVRPGVVLIAPTHEYNHFYRQAAIYVYAMGENDNDNDEYLIRGVIIDHPTPFTLGEMIPKLNNTKLGEKLLYRGGDKGTDGVILLHNQKNLGQKMLEEIGTSGIYEGGWDQAIEFCEKKDNNDNNNNNNFKAFFNYCEFTEQELDDMLKSSSDNNEEDSDDSWASVEVDSSMVLNQEWDRGDCWKRLRNTLRQIQQK